MAEEPLTSKKRGRGARHSADRHLLRLPFDHYQRYALTQRMMALLWPRHEDHALKILDVGGHSSPLKHFLPTHDVVLADVKPPGSHTTLPLAYDTYLLASGTKLPLADLSFDLVTANDTLEHVRDADRPAFLQELLRVSRRFVILNGPIYNPQTAEAEHRFARFLLRALSETSDFLQEHIDLGLPKAEDIEKVLIERGLPFIGIPNGNLTLWLAMNAAKGYVRALPDADQLSEILDKTYNQVLSPRDFGGLCYRKAYVIAKSGNGMPGLRRLQAAFSPLLEKPPVSDNVGALGGLVAALEEHAAQVRRSIAELEQAKMTLAEKEALQVRTEERLHDVQVQLQAATSSVGYRMLERVRRRIRFLAPEGTRRHAAFLAMSRGLNTILTQGWGPFLGRFIQVWTWAPRFFALGHAAQPLASLDDQYQRWLRSNAITRARIKTIRQEMTQFLCRPLISVVMPVYNPDPRRLKEAIESVRAQLYGNWELCIADDHSTDPAILSVLEDYAHADRRINVVYLKENRGISAASNQALAVAKGEFVGLLDHDDELKTDALFEVVKLINSQPDLDFIYTDEDHRARDGRLVQPFFKPDWSPDLLLSVNYVPHFAVYRKHLVDEVGGFRSECDLSQDYDLTLRVTERTDRIAHIPLPLYTWRMNPRSASATPKAKLQAVEAAKRALSEAMQRRGLEADVFEGSVITTYRVRYRIRGQPLVSIIIPTRDRVDLLRRCITSIEQKSTYPNYEIVIVDNGSNEEHTLKYLEESPHRRLAYPGPFHYSAMMNFAARETSGNYILFLNNDTAVIAPEWIEAMLEHCQREEVAAAGARLLYPDGRVQHEGIIIGLAGGCAANVDHGGYFGLQGLVHNCSAVTAACMMTRRDVFERLGGFDENLEVAFNDVDYCLRAREQGFLVVYTPYALLHHDEGGTRGWGISEQDKMFFRKRWGNPGEYRDPYYNPNLDLLRPFNISPRRR